MTMLLWKAIGEDSKTHCESTFATGRVTTSEWLLNVLSPILTTNVLFAS